MAANLKAVRARQSKVENGERPTTGCGESHAFVAIPSYYELVAKVVQVERHQLRNVLFILNQQYAAFLHLNDPHRCPVFVSDSGRYGIEYRHSQPNI